MERLSFDHLGPHARAWNLAMAASPGPLDLEIPAAAIDGAIPGPLRGGRLLSNGPGWTVIGGRVAHPFDGHGYVRAFEFREDGGVRLRARFVGTRVYRDEAAAGRILYRGLATNVEGGRRRNLGLRSGAPRNVANTTITRWGDRLIAGWEGGTPHALDAESLETLGEETFGGLIAGQATLAHMRKDAARGRLVLCSSAGARNPRLTFRELDVDGALVASRSVTIPGSLFIHDFVITPNWYVISGNPMRLKLGALAQMLSGGGTLLDAVAADEARPGVLHLIPRSGVGPARTVRLPDHAFVVHFGGAFERDGAVIVDACAFRSYTFGEEFGYRGPNAPFDPALPDARAPQRLYRVTIPAGAEVATWAQLVPHGVDFPRVHPDGDGCEVDLLFGACRADPRHSDPFDTILRVDLRDPERPPQLWTAPPDLFVGEPIFAPDPARGDAGHVLAILSDGLGGASTLAIFDAAALDAGPIARVRTPLLPIAFHGDWDPR
ncbi:MAG: carotenoid oxygenase family protein [Myxococcales bacterium]|nr:carotenoid oxygenase family protein [Myxococcales bacterium]MCB9568657.1 carotenoid oxygenase family protein [Myxococcales bacterium]MCB9705970.1 carotenoid oxygenase family protein [Myxococcales bacterium]